MARGAIASPPYPLAHSLFVRHWCRWA